MHIAYATNTGLRFCCDCKSCRYRSDKVNGPIFPPREHRHFSFSFLSPFLDLLLQTNDEIFHGARICRFLLP